MRKALIVIVTLGLIAGIASVAVATIPDSSGVIHGCYDNKTRALRVIDTDKGQSCTKSETALTWNQIGPQGPAGPAGPQGPQGEPGPVGPPGPAGSAMSFHVVSELRAVPLVPGNRFDGIVRVNCPAGETAVSAAAQAFVGTSAQISDQGLRWTASPIGDSPPTGYDFWALYSTERSGDTLRFYVTCAMTDDGTVPTTTEEPPTTAGPTTTAVTRPPTTIGPTTTEDTVPPTT